MTTEDTPTEDPIERWRRETLARAEAERPSRRTRLANWIEDQAELVIMDPITGVVTQEERWPARCEHHNSRGECELYEVGEPRDREQPTPTSPRMDSDRPPEPNPTRPSGGPNGGSGHRRGGKVGPGEPRHTPTGPMPLIILLVAAALALAGFIAFGPGNAPPPAEVDQP